MEREFARQRQTCGKRQEEHQDVSSVFDCVLCVLFCDHQSAYVYPSPVLGHFLLKMLPFADALSDP